MDTGKRYHDSSSEDENILRPIDEALKALKHLKKGLDKMESAMCLYETEYEPMGDPYNNKEQPFNPLSPMPAVLAVKRHVKTIAFPTIPEDSLVLLLFYCC